MKNIDNKRVSILNQLTILISFLLAMLLWSIPGASGSTYEYCLEGDLECDSECDEIGEGPEDDLYISSYNPSIFSSCLRIDGVLHIDENTDLYEAQLIMDPGAEIVVDAGYRLTISSSIIIAGCEELWKGIRVEDGATFHTYYSKISGANAAIFLENRCSLRAWYSTFENNYIGIATAMPYDVSSEPKVVAQNLILGCDFINTDVLRTPYTGHYYDPDWPTDADIPYDRDFAAIYLRNTNGLNVGINSVVSSTRNVIDGLRNGIVIEEKSTVDVGYCDISNLKGFITLSGLTEDLTSTGIYSGNSVVRVHDNDLNQMQDGIVSWQSRADIVNNDILLKNITLPDIQPYTRGIAVLNCLEPTTVDLNVIDEADVGILLYGGFTGQIEITDNTITSETDEKSRTGIQVNAWRPKFGTSLIEGNIITFEDVYSGNGIWINAAYNAEVLDNTVTFLRENEENNKSSSGIRVYYCVGLNIEDNNIIGEGEYATTGHFGIFYQNSPVNRAFCNDIDSFARGFLGAGNSQMSKLVSNYWGPSNVVGLNLVAPTRMGTQEHFGNRWLDDFDPSVAALMTGDPDDYVITALNSQFKIDNDNICDLWPCPISPGGIATSWFIDLTGSDLTCDPNNPIVPTDEDFEFHLMNPLEFENFSDEMTWMTKAWIFENILRDDDLLMNATLDSFYNADDTEPLGVLVSADYAIRDANEDVVALADIDEEILDSLSILVWIDEELYDLSPDSNALRSRREDLVDSLEVLQDDRFTMLSDIVNERSTSLSGAATSLGSLSTNTDFEEFYRRALLYEIEAATSGLASLSAGDWEEIQEIATLCGWEGGRATSIAQSLCSIGRDSIVDPLMPCTGVDPRSAKDEVSVVTGQLSAHPNPSSAGWNVIIPMGTNKLRTIDVQGKILSTIEIPKDATEWYLPSFETGVFILLAISQEGHILDTEKIVMQR